MLCWALAHSRIGPGELHEPFLAQAGGKPIQAPVGHLAPILYDFDKDGLLDLAVGTFSPGNIRVYRNVGKPGAPEFKGFVAVQAGNFKSEGKDIEAGDGGPCLTDWNADGKLDLLLGDEAGNVILYLGTGKVSLELGKAEYVLPHQTTEQGWREVKRDPASPTGLSAKRPGARVSRSRPIGTGTASSTFWSATSCRSSSRRGS